MTWRTVCVRPYAAAVIEPRPRHRLHLTYNTVEKSGGRMDNFGVRRRRLTLVGSRVEPGKSRFIADLKAVLTPVDPGSKP